MMKVEPNAQHRWLGRLVGEWVMESMTTPESPGGEDAAMLGTETVRSLDGIWVVGEGRMTLPDGGEATTLLTLGYDPARGCFVGSWIGSMMTHLWTYHGQLDEAGAVLTLDTEGPRFTPDGAPAAGLARYQDIISFDDDGYRILRSRMLGDDGAWREFMRARYRRAG